MQADHHAAALRRAREARAQEGLIGATRRMLHANDDLSLRQEEVRAADGLDVTAAHDANGNSSGVVIDLRDELGPAKPGGLMSRGAYRVGCMVGGVLGAVLLVGRWVRKLRPPYALVTALLWTAVLVAMLALWGVVVWLALR